MKAIRILIAASGSGGHLLPALLIAKELMSSEEVEIRFLGSGRPLEAKLLSQSGIRRYEVPISGLVGRGARGIFQFGITAPIAFYRVWRIFSEFKPQVVVGVGGYASFLPVFVGFLRGIPTWIHEAEVTPGLTNRTLAPLVSRVSVGFENCRLTGQKVLFSGHPIKDEICSVKARTREQGPPKNLLILGGSQGASAVDKAFLELLEFLSSKHIKILHQCRPECVAMLEQAYRSKQIDAQVTSFIDSIADAYNWSDIVVSRAGAASVNELAIVNRPAILIPLPGSQGGHQTVNALYLSNAGKGEIVEQNLALAQNLQSKLEILLDPNRYFEILERECLDRPRTASTRIADGILQLAGVKN